MEKKLYEELNKQVSEEFYAAYLYLSMSNWLENENFPGMAKWMKTQAKEETEHAMKIREYLQDRGEKVNLAPLAAVETEFKSPLACFEAALKHEQYVTGRFNMMFELARKAKDYAAEIALQWFINEQVEEEKQCVDAIAYLKKADKNIGAIMMLDSVFGKRD